MAENRPGVMLYFETLQAIEELDAEEAKQIMSAILHYCRDGEEPAFRGMPAALWRLIRGGLDRDGARYNEKQLRGLWLTYCRKCKNAEETPLGFDEWASTQHDNDTLLYVERVVNRAVNVPQPSPSPSTSTSPSPSPTKDIMGAHRARFAPPTLDEVRAYCRERKNSVDPERFMDYYQANGWRVGKNPMKDWKAAVRNWEKGTQRQSAEAAPDPLSGFHTADEESW